MLLRFASVFQSADPPLVPFHCVEQACCAKGDIFHQGSEAAHFLRQIADILGEKLNIQRQGFVPFS